MTTATGSPAKRTLSVASRVNSGVGPPTASRAMSASGPGTVIVSSSAPVSAATTPGSSRAAETSTESTRACASGERTNAACSIPGSLMSSTYRPAPVRMRGSSERLMLAPVYRSAAIAVMAPPRSAPPGALGGQQDAVDDALVAGAAADVAGQRLADLLLVGIRVGAEERRRLHDHPGRAETALEAVRVPHRLLQRAQLPTPRPCPL